MTVNDVYGLRNQGRVEEAYQLAREIYASDKSPYTSVAMFWAAADMLKKCVSECRTNEAMRIYMALERLLKGVKDEKGWMHDALEKSRTLLDKSDSREHQTYNGAEHLQTGAGVRSWQLPICVKRAMSFWNMTGVRSIATSTSLPGKATVSCL